MVDSRVQVWLWRVHYRCGGGDYITGVVGRYGGGQ